MKTTPGWKAQTPPVSMTAGTSGKPSGTELVQTKGSWNVTPCTTLLNVLFPKLKSSQQEADFDMKRIHSFTEKWKFFKAGIQGEDNTYLLPWHPSLLLTSRCRSPSKRDFSSGENESGSSTFYKEQKHKKRHFIIQVAWSAFPTEESSFSLIVPVSNSSTCKYSFSRKQAPELQFLRKWGFINPEQWKCHPHQDLTTVSVIRSISCLSLVLCCLKGLWL